GLDRGHEDARVERADLAAAAGAAFGEHADRAARAQAREHFVQHPAERFGAAARMEDGVAARGQPADHRPAGDFALGDETHHALAVQDLDVDPADVVGDEQGRARPAACRSGAGGSRRSASTRPTRRGSCGVPGFPPPQGMRAVGRVISSRTSGRWTNTCHSSKGVRIR
ncbi:hypothetical protein CATMIT_01915, partial [Catenibacterium mitsuokai DSM 15897]